MLEARILLALVLQLTGGIGQLSLNCLQLCVQSMDMLATLGQFGVCLGRGRAQLLHLGRVVSHAHLALLVQSGDGLLLLRMGLAHGIHLTLLRIHLLGERLDLGRQRRQRLVRRLQLAFPCTHRRMFNLQLCQLGCSAVELRPCCSVGVGQGIGGTCGV